MSTAATTASRAPSAPRRSEGWFYVGMGVVAMAITAAGFVPALADPASRRAPITLAVAAHGVLFAAWLLLFVAQTLLVGRGRIGLHRWLGYAAAPVALLMVVSGYFLSIATARRGYDLSGDLNIEGDPVGQLVFQLGDLLSFTVVVAAGLWFRWRPQAHKRLMLLATVASLMPASLAHVIGHSHDPQNPPSGSPDIRLASEPGRIAVNAQLYPMGTRFGHPPAPQPASPSSSDAPLTADEAERADWAQRSATRRSSRRPQPARQTSFRSSSWSVET